MPEVIETDRLSLRPYVAGDAEAICKQIGNYRISQWLTRVPHPYSTSDAHAFFDRNAGDPCVKAVIYRGHLIGCVSILRNDLGYWFGIAHWGHGFATEAARAMLAAYFAAGQSGVGSGYLEGNTGSRNVLEKLGFAPTEIVSIYAASRKCKVPNHRMTLTRETWNAAA